MTQKREFFRVAIERTGQIGRGAESSPCSILDLTEKGFLLRTGLPVAIGDELELEFDLAKATLKKKEEADENLQKLKKERETETKDTLDKLIK